MPSPLHEALVHLFRAQPKLAAELLEEVLGVPLPPHDWARVVDSDVTDVSPVSHSADLVVTLGDANGIDLAIIVEVQLRVDPRKRRTWPRYLTALGAELDCRAVVLVVTPDSRVQRWAAERIVVGLGDNVITPFVLGPDDIPRIEAETADVHPELAVLSAIAHGDAPDAVEIARVALGAAARLDEDLGATYTDFILNALNTAARTELEREMREANYYQQTGYVERWLEQGREQGREQGHEQGREEGRREGQARALLAVLEARGFVLDEQARRRILGCDDHEQLSAWLTAAAIAERVEDVFGEG